MAAPASAAAWACWLPSSPSRACPGPRWTPGERVGEELVVGGWVGGCWRLADCVAGCCSHIPPLAPTPAATTRHPRKWCRQLWLCSPTSGQCAPPRWTKRSSRRSQPPPRPRQPRLRKRRPPRLRLHGSAGRSRACAARCLSRRMQRRLVVAPLAQPLARMWSSQRRPPQQRQRCPRPRRLEERRQQSGRHRRARPWTLPPQSIQPLALACLSQTLNNVRRTWTRGKLAGRSSQSSRSSTARSSWCRRRLPLPDSGRGARLHHRQLNAHLLRFPRPARFTLTSTLYSPLAACILLFLSHQPLPQNRVYLLFWSPQSGGHW